MNINYELILFYAVLVTGLIVFLDKVFLAKKRKQTKLPILIEYSRSFLPVLVIVFLLRAFLIEPFRIPSSSLEPTLLVGDFILVSKYDYGVRLPIVHEKIFGKGQPKRGDIIVFRWPPDPGYDLIKRVIGLPGDHLNYINKELYVNGQKVSQEYLQNIASNGIEGPQKKQEDLLGVKHKIYINPMRAGRDYKDIVVPKGMYFVMGDNRDASADSRYWGFVPDENIIGKAVLILGSWDKSATNLRWGRTGSVIR